MPTQKKFKQRVRARQEREGISYSESRRIEDKAQEIDESLFDEVEDIPESAVWLYDSSDCRILVLHENPSRLEVAESPRFQVPELRHLDPEFVRPLLEKCKGLGVETYLCRSVRDSKPVYGMMIRDPEGQIVVKEPLTEIQEHELRQRDALMSWWQENPGVYEVRLKAQPNEHGTAEVLVEVRFGEGESVSFVTLGNMTYLEAIAMGLHHAKNQVPRDDLGNLPDCS